MCVGCQMANIPVCAATGPCMPIAQQALHYAVLVGAVGLGTMRLFFRTAYDRFMGAVKKFAYARYDVPEELKASRSDAAGRNSD
jgi:hypothetical protein